MQHLTVMVCTIDTNQNKINDDFNGFFRLFLEHFPSLNVLEQELINDGCLVCQIKVKGAQDELESFFNQREVQKFAQASLIP